MALLTCKICFWLLYYVWFFSDFYYNAKYLNSVGIKLLAGSVHVKHPCQLRRSLVLHQSLIYLQSPSVARVAMHSPRDLHYEYAKYSWAFILYYWMRIPGRTRIRLSFVQFSQPDPRALGDSCFTGKRHKRPERLRYDCSKTGLFPYLESRDILYCLNIRFLCGVMRNSRKSDFDYSCTIIQWRNIVDDLCHGISRRLFTGWWSSSR